MITVQEHNARLWKRSSDTKDLNKIKDVHDLWIAKELEGNGSEVIDLCTQDIQWLAPNDPPIVGKEEIAKHLAAHSMQVESIDISDLCIHGSFLAYLISNYPLAI